MKVLKFGAIWCSGCLVMKPLWAEIEKENPWLETEYHDVDEESEFANAFQIQDYPCFIFLDKEEKEIHREYGQVEKKKLIELINSYKDK
ncbi:thioredoxin family protein [Candidatus Dojkabacteria bacterium]|nr:thioredoxin family protein [Candidatus Dojkabacteria bacterium]